MKTCARCTRWRPHADYGASDSYGARLDWCQPCRRLGDLAPTGRPSLDAPPPPPCDDGRLHAYRSAARRVAGHDAYWLTPRFRRWLRAKADEHGWLLISEWAGVNERNARRWLAPDSLIISIDPADRLLLWEGTARLDDFWPLPTQPDELARAA